MSDNQYLLSFLRSQFSDGVALVPLERGFKLSLPFTDNVDDPIELFVDFKDERIFIDDFGHIAGMLFEMGQHSRDSIGHQLIRNLSEVYDFSIDYDRGVLLKTISGNQLPQIIDYIKAITSMRTILPEINYKKKERRTGRRLGTELGQQVRQLRLPHLVSRQAEVKGKNETWVVDYRYLVRANGEQKDIVIVTADLQWGEPREKAAHVVTLAMDVLGSQDKKDLRIIYNVDHNGNGLAARRAASLIEDNKNIVGYNAYDYSDPERRLALLSLLHQELSLLPWPKKQSVSD